MKRNRKNQVIIFLMLVLIIGTSFNCVTSSKVHSLICEKKATMFNGQILFAPYYGTTTYLIDSTGTVNHTWPSAYRPFTEAYWLGDGSIMRPIISGGGGLQKILWDGTKAWDYRYTVNGCTCHHDIQCLPNGNVLMIVWVTKTRAEAIAAGRNPTAIQGNTFTPDKIIEVKQTGPNSGSIVWEWHVWDHLIQDYDPLKDNYGVVGDHPELIDINFGDPFVGDWLHTNALDYNPEFDQILVDVHNFNEVWVIDHTTTTEEASGHTGGNYGKGGDLLYRWGNPEAYDAGTASDQKLFFQHDASWIKPGYPGEGDILVFDNGNNRPGGQYSTIDQFTPPINEDGEYYLEEGEAYGPEDYTWRYIANPPGSFYSSVFGGALRIKDGNTLICGGLIGKFYEVTPENEIVWQYTNPYPNPSQNDVFLIDYVAPEEPEPPVPNTPDLDCSGSLSWSDVQPGAMISGSFQVQNIGDPDSLLNWTIDISSISWGTWTFNPESQDGLTPEDGQVTAQITVIAPDEKNSEFEGYIRVENRDNSSDYDEIPVYLKTPVYVNVFNKPIYQYLLKFKSLFLEMINNLFIGNLKSL